MFDFYTALIQFMLFVFASFFLSIIVLVIYNLSNNVINFRKKRYVKNYFSEEHV